MENKISKSKLKEELIDDSNKLVEESEENVPLATFPAFARNIKSYPIYLESGKVDPEEQGLITQAEWQTLFGYFELVK